VEVLAVVPSLHDDFTTEPIFVRDDLDSPLRWTGARPPAALTRSIERSYGREALIRVFGQ
jgi:hypothetical protein